MLQLSTFIAELARKAKEETGAALAEYGLLVALIAVICIGAITLLGTGINTAFDAIQKAINGAN